MAIVKVLKFVIDLVDIILSIFSSAVAANIQSLSRCQKQCAASLRDSSSPFVFVTPGFVGGHIKKKLHLQVCAEGAVAEAVSVGINDVVAQLDASSRNVLRSTRMEGLGSVGYVWYKYVFK